MTVFKKGHRYIYSYLPGQEQQALETLIAAAQDPTCDLDWFDVMVLSHQLPKEFADKMHVIVKDKLKG